MALTSEQLDAWRAANRATLHPGKLQRWVFIVSQAHAATEADIERVIRGVMGRVVRGAVDDLRMVRTSPTQISAPGGAVQRRETLPEPPIPFVVPGPVNWAEVEFAWRSPVQDVPWIAERMQAGLFPVDDPTAADIMLDSVGTPGGEAQAPRTGAEELLDDIGDSLTETPGRALLTALAVGGLGYLLFRKLRG